MSSDRAKVDVSRMRVARAIVGQWDAAMVFVPGPFRFASMERPMTRSTRSSVGINTSIYANKQRSSEIMMDGDD